MKILARFFVVALLVSITASAQNYFATVLKSTGSVYVKPSGETEFNVNAEMGMGLHIGDAIMTGDDGFVAVIFTKDKSLVKIRKNSEVSIREEYSVRTVKVSEGRVLASVTPGVKGSFRVETPTSVASVKGTKFWTVTSSQFGDRFYGVEGNVNVMNLITGVESNMAPGQMIISTPQGQLVNMPVDPDDMPVDPDDEAPKPEQEPQAQPEEQVSKPETTTPPSDMAAAPSEMPAEVAEPKEKGSGSDKPFGMGLGLGSVTMDDKIYNQIALRPEFRISKLAVALDIAIYMDEQGNIRKDEWDELSDYFD
ncbi:MAG: FecR domain-containing protein, partial [Candidatus Marinimicrobia bacterium]|nr:FecR domain-containing protein [Candidatus Neomarinimicrobiota bacterium]